MPSLMLSSTHSQTQQLAVPPQRLSQHQVLLPPTPAHRLRAALAGALEEQLLDDPADLHFALAPDAQSAMKAGRAFDVLVCDKAWLQEQLIKAQAQGQVIASIVPEAKELQAQGWDLAQFEFRRKSRLATRVLSALDVVWQAPQWRWARWAVVILLLVQVLGLNVWAWRDKAQLRLKQEQINRLLTQAYPETTTVVDAPLQMKKALIHARALRGALDGQGLEAQLASKALPGKAYSQVGYANHELTLTELTRSQP